MNHIGLDLHKSYSYLVVLDDDGTVIDQRRLANEAVAPYLKEVEQPVQVTFEATYNWQYMYEQLEGLVAQVVLAHPKQVRAIAAARIKHDRIDARVLAELLRSNLVPVAYVPRQETRDLRDLVRHRAHLSRQRTRLKNRMHAILARYDVRRPSGGLFTRKGVLDEKHICSKSICVK